MNIPSLFKWKRQPAVISSEIGNNNNSMSSFALGLDSIDLITSVPHVTISRITLNPIFSAGARNQDKHLSEYEKNQLIDILAIGALVDFQEEMKTAVNKDNISIPRQGTVKLLFTTLENILVWASTSRSGPVYPLSHLFPLMDKAQVMECFNGEWICGLFRKYMAFEQRMVYWRFRMRDIFLLIKETQNIWPSMKDLCSLNQVEAPPYINDHQKEKMPTAQGQSLVNMIQSIVSGAQRVRELYDQIETTQKVCYLHKKQNKVETMAMPVTVWNLMGRKAKAYKDKDAGKNSDPNAGANTNPKKRKFNNSKSESRFWKKR